MRSKILLPPFLLLWAIVRPAYCAFRSSFRSQQGTREISRDEPASVQLPLRRTAEGWYSVELQLGGASTHLLVDTGSSALWARIPASSNVSAPSSKSSLGKFTAQYGRGAVSGEVVEAPVLLTSDAAAAKSHACRVGRPIDEVGFWAKQRTIDGVLGLGCSGENAVADALACVLPTPPQRPLLLGPSRHRVFTLQLTSSGGTLTLGSVPQEVQLNMVGMPETSDCGHWTVPLLSLSVQNSEATTGAQKLVGDAQAVLDSGSDGVIGPTFAVIELARRLGASPGKAGEGYGGEVTFYEVPCDSVLNLPSLTLVLGAAQGATVSVTPPGADLVAAGKDGDETCRLRLAGWETESWILGAVFLTHLQGVVFDVDSGAVAIAPSPQAN